MNVNFEYSKTLAGEGAILLILGLVPTVGWVLAIIGIVLLLKSMREFSYYYQDESIYQNALTGLKYYIVAIVAIAVAGAAVVLGIGISTAFNFANFVPTLTSGIGIAAVVIVGFVVAFVFFVLAAQHLRKTFYSLAEKSGESNLHTAGDLLWYGSILTIVFGVGLLLIFIAWIFATIGFFTMKSRQYQQYAQQPYGYTPPSYTPPPTAPQAPQGTATAPQAASQTPHTFFRTIEGRGLQ